MFKSNLIAVTIINAFVPLIFSLGDAREHHESEEQHEISHAASEVAHEHEAHAASVEMVATEAQEKEQKATDAWRSKFKEGSWQWEVLDFLDSKDLSKMITLERVPFEGEELASEGMADDHLLDGADPEDKSQRRITVLIQK